MKTEPIPLPTYVKIILSGWPAIFEIISKYTRVKKNLINVKLPLLSTEQLEEVFMDKQHNFIQYSITMRAKVLILFIALNHQLDELRKQKREAAQALITLEDYLKADRNNQRIIESIEIAQDCLSNIKNTEADLSKKQEMFKSFNDKIDQLLQKHDQEWKDFKDQWSATMIQELEKIGVSLTTLEKTEIQRHKTIAELIERMRELGLSLPKSLQKL